MTRGDKNAMALRKLSRLLDRLSPETLALEEADAKGRRSDPALALYKGIAALCHGGNIDLHLYSAEEIQRCFGMIGAATRQETAEAVARQLQVFAPRLPKPRKPWQSEPRRLAILNAAAVALTHHAAPSTTPE